MKKENFTTDSFLTVELNKISRSSESSFQSVSFPQIRITGFVKTSANTLL